MYVSLPPGCYASAVMCEEHSIVLFFFSNFKSFVFGSIFFRCYCQCYLVRFLFQVFVCLFACLFVFISGKLNTNLFTFSRINIYDGCSQSGYSTIRFLEQV